ncbi:adenosine deaminase AGSA [Phlebotomus papatasi]|uniref:adenosine deaminase AGSA n=1 Tax=Phlebotomus papatasi TaxID=29031 RepID=UPI002483F92D|nr:adenosine deaminase AGSA [Phlebotomus papatasi]
MFSQLVVWLLAVSAVHAAFDIKTWRMNREYENYLQKRAYYLAEEEDRSVGSDIVLTAKEEIVNERLMALKTAELEAGLENPSQFIPWNHFFDVLERINSSEIFHIIQRMPKGGILHAHDTAICSTDYVVSLTYEPNLWQCTNPTTGALEFRFSREAPPNTETCQWTLVSEERARQGEEQYNSQLRSQLSLYNTDPINHNRDVDSIWREFMGLFGVNFGLLTYAPVWKAYYKNYLKEMLLDGVQYLELRGTLPQLYDLDGKTYNEEENLQIYLDATREFKQENPTFIGAKFIYAPVRVVDDAGIKTLMAKVTQLHERFPNFLAGFDLVGQEDKGRPLIDFSQEILQLPDTINFYFHSGETNWNGLTDINLIDAVLLGSKRLGHGYAIFKHTKVLKMVKREKIAIEVCPISNQVLRLVSDMRNHPGSILLANKEYPVVISSDDPSFWEATPLSHDFYMAFMGLASSRQDLRMLKQLAINSIKYSAMTPMEKLDAMKLWEEQWKKFIDELAA